MRRASAIRRLLVVTGLFLWCCALAYAETGVAAKGYATEEVVSKTGPVARESAQMVSGETLRVLLLSYIASRMPWDAADTTIDVQTPPKITGLPSGKLTVEFDCPKGYKYLGDAPFKATLIVDRKPCKSLYVKASVHPFKEVVVALRDIERGEPITDGDFTMVKKDLARIANGFVTDSEVLRGVVAARTIAAGSVISLRCVERPITIKRGTVVVAEVLGKGFRVSTKAKALDSGRVGDVIRLANLDSKRTLVGEVLNGDTVRVVQ